MKIGILGAGHVGSVIARRATEAGHEVVLSFARDPADLVALAAQLGPRAQAGTVAEAAQADLLVMSVPWAAIPAVLAQAGPLAGKVLIDTSNPDASNPLHVEGLLTLPKGVTSGSFNAARLPGVTLIKAFNTLTAGFQAEAQQHPGQTAMFFCGGDAHSKALAAQLIVAQGFAPVDLGSLAEGVLMDAPKREGAVYGEAFTPDNARQIAALAATDLPAAMRLASETREVFTDPTATRPSR